MGQRTNGIRLSSCWSIKRVPARSGPYIFSWVTPPWPYSLSHTTAIDSDAILQSASQKERNRMILNVFLLPESVKTS
ncbi:TPA: hypothetical protein ACM7HR_004033, partial [Escherichia coli]